MIVQDVRCHFHLDCAALAIERAAGEVRIAFPDAIVDRWMKVDGHALTSPFCGKCGRERPRLDIRDHERIASLL
jgi:hypothetical protein